MQNTSRISRRNQSMECCKMFAAILIVFAHVPFPGVVGELINCFFRFSVPVFFAISGYFSFGTKGEKLLKRLIHILILNAAAIAACILWGCFEAVWQGESLMSALRGIIPGVKGVAGWIFMHTNPFSGHLWYLTAIAACYGVLWLYVTFFGEDRIDYRPLYITSVVLFSIRFLMSDLMRFIGYDIPYFFTRDGLFYGLPMVSLGIFLREHYDRIRKNFRLTDAKLLGIFLVGVLLSLLQWKSFGTGELPMGAVIQALAMLLFMIEHPTADFGSKAAAKVISILGYLSAAVYILHMIINDAYMLFAEQRLIALVGKTERWLQPFIVLAATVLVSLALKGILNLNRHIQSRRTKAFPKQ